MSEPKLDRDLEIILKEWYLGDTDLVHATKEIKALFTMKTITVPDLSEEELKKVLEDINNLPQGEVIMRPMTTIKQCIVCEEVLCIKNQENDSFAYCCLCVPKEYRKKALKDYACEHCLGKVKE